MEKEKEKENLSNNLHFHINYKLLLDYNNLEYDNK